MANADDTRAETQASPQAEQTEILISREELINCSLPAWYEQFKNVTFKTVFIPLPEEFIDYLNTDGCVLPQGCELPSLSHSATHNDSDSDSDEVDWTENEEESDTKSVPSFPKLLEDISSALKDLGGNVLPKLNWSSPRDAVWIAPGHTLKCSTPAEIFLLLKSSDFIAHDLSRVSEYCKVESTPESTHPILYTLCLRQWQDFLPSMEFRCFVCDRCLIAISQRNYSTFYKFLQENQERIKVEINDFYHREIAEKFPNKNYIFDIVRISEDRFHVVDFNPYCPITDPLLFSWEELTSEEFTSASVNHPVFRLVDGDRIQPSDLHSLQLPLDVVDIASGMDAHKFIDLIRAKTGVEEGD